MPRLVLRLVLRLVDLVEAPNEPGDCVPVAPLVFRLVDLVIAPIEPGDCVPIAPPNSEAENPGHNVLNKSISEMFPLIGLNLFTITSVLNGVFNTGDISGVKFNLTLAAFAIAWIN